MTLRYRPERTWKFRGWTISVNIDSIPAPSLRWYWWERGMGFFDLALDNGGDPIVALCSPTFAPPRWLMPLVNLCDR